MNRSTIAVLCIAAISTSAWAQSPEDEWGAVPTPAPAPVLPPTPQPEPVVPPPVPSYQPTPYVPSAGVGLRPRADVIARVRPPEERNDISVHGATPLGSGKRGQSLTLGFPLINIRALFGLGDSFDLGVGFDSYYFLMNEPRAVARLSIARNENWAFAARLEAGYAFFTQRASRENRGARWLTGQRNININPALIVSYQGSAARAARLFFELRYNIALDTEPYATDPLVGVPPAVVVGHNVGLIGGAELPLSAKTSFIFCFGFDVHSRADDSVLMPMASVGLVTSL
jgi:hypothetical protein